MDPMQLLEATRHEIGRLLTLQSQIVRSPELPDALEAYIDAAITSLEELVRVELIWLESRQ